MKVSLQPPTASPSQKESKTSLLPELLSVIDERLRNSESIDTYMSGAVAVLLILTDTHAVVANIGDSRVIVGIQADSPAEWIPQQLTTDHNCENLCESKRLLLAGASIRKLQVDDLEQVGPLRVFKGTMPYPGIGCAFFIQLNVTACSRTFGDDVAKRLGVIADAEIVLHRISSRDRCIIIASDGVWDALSNHDVTDCAFLHFATLDAEKASQAITQLSLKLLDQKCIDDNVTNICIFLHD